VLGVVVPIAGLVILPPDRFGASGPLRRRAIGFVTMLLAGFVAFDLVVYRQAGASESRLLHDLTFGLLAMSGMPTTVAVAAYAVGGYRYRMLPRGTAHLAAVTAVAHRRHHAPTHDLSGPHIRQPIGCRSSEWTGLCPDRCHRQGVMPCCPSVSSRP
jgi:hypothetical protein